VVREGSHEFPAVVEAGHAEQHRNVVPVEFHIGERVVHQAPAYPLVAVSFGGGHPAEPAHLEAGIAEAHRVGNQAEPPRDFRAALGDTGVLREIPGVARAAVLQPPEPFGIVVGRMDAREEVVHHPQLIGRLDGFYGDFHGFPRNSSPDIR